MKNNIKYDFTWVLQESYKVSAHSLKQYIKQQNELIL